MSDIHPTESADCVARSTLDGLDAIAQRLQFLDDYTHLFQ